jgi:hypothetical protein
MDMGMPSLISLVVHQGRIGPNLAQAKANGLSASWATKPTRELSGLIGLVAHEESTGRITILAFHYVRACQYGVVAQVL